MEASAVQASAGLARTRIALGTSLLRLRSDEQLVALFRAGHDEAFRVIHDRYKQRLFAYTRQMLPGSRQDAEDALQDVFVRAYAGLRANDRELTLRAWLYRVAHNRCVDELRRPALPAPEVLGMLRAPACDPAVQAEQRESLRRLVEDLGRLPEQQRSALLMRELEGMPYSDVADALGVSLAAVKSLLVRARVGLAQALEARDTACSEIRDELIVAHDRGVRPSGLVRRHMRDCAGCREFRSQMRGFSRQFASLVPTLGPLAVLANLFGLGSGGGGAAAAGGGAGAGAAGAGAGGAGAAGAGAAGAGAAGAGAGAASAGASLVAVGHVATLLAAAVVTAGGAVELHNTLAAPVVHHARHYAVHVVAAHIAPVLPAAAPSTTTDAPNYTSAIAASRTRAGVRARHADTSSATGPHSRKVAHGAKTGGPPGASVPTTGGGSLGSSSDPTSGASGATATDGAGVENPGTATSTPAAPITGTDPAAGTGASGSASSSGATGSGVISGSDVSVSGSGAAGTPPGSTTDPPATSTSDPTATTSSATSSPTSSGSASGSSS